MKGLRGLAIAVVLLAVFWLWGRGLPHPPSGAPHLPIGVHISVPPHTLKGALR